MHARAAGQDLRGDVHRCGLASAPGSCAPLRVLPHRHLAAIAGRDHNMQVRLLLVHISDAGCLIICSLLSEPDTGPSDYTNLLLGLNIVIITVLRKYDWS